MQKNVIKKVLLVLVAVLLVVGADMLLARKKTYDSLNLEFKNKQIEYGTVFNIDDLVKSHTGMLDVAQKPDTNSIGEYETVFVLSDYNRYKQLVKKEITETIEVRDTKKPIIEIEEDNVNVYVGNTYDLKDNIVKVYDEVDGDIDDYKIEADVDFEAIGEYPVKIIADDKNGLQSETEYTITVKRRPVAGGSEGYNYIYDKLTSVYGYNKAAACGILANMRFESNFNSDIGDYYYGLCQWGGGRKDNLYSFCSNNGLDASSIDGQLAFMNYELDGAYSGVKSYLLSIDNSGSGAWNAGDYFCRYYEGAASAAGRGDQAQAYFES